jgi:hypothetical protein
MLNIQPLNLSTSQSDAAFGTACAAPKIRTFGDCDIWLVHFGLITVNLARFIVRRLQFCIMQRTPWLCALASHFEWFNSGSRTWLWFQLISWKRWRYLYIVHIAHQKDECRICPPMVPRSYSADYIKCVHRNTIPSPCLRVERAIWIHKRVWSKSTFYDIVFNWRNIVSGHYYCRTDVPLCDSFVKNMLLINSGHT